ncbi:MAG: exopolysaccharide biosynthesis polyprenyl glycosylphosphotransferase [Oscillospiraceae bacterium]|nr:exopolysaccharide biosynthesis polyprenyl glycosylphosphotransferase [Oscillospiraceae bacterium]
MTRKTAGIRLFSAKALLFLTVLGVFFVGQNLFYRETLFYFWGNNIVLLLYAATLYLATKIYHAFSFGSAGLPEIILSWALCLIITDTFEYFRMGLLELRLLPVFGMLVILAAQTAAVVILAFFTDKLYYRLNPAQNAAVVYGSEEKAKSYAKLLKDCKNKFNVILTVSQSEAPETLFSRLDGAESVFFLDVCEEKRELLLEYCFRSNKRSYFLPTFSGVLTNSAELVWISGTPMFLPKSPVRDAGSLMVKRCIDIAVSLTGIVLLSWLMLIVWAAIKLYDGAPAVYRQTRETKDGKLFTLYKFRSMRPDAESDGVPRLAAKNDERITPVGRFIRKTRIDELPQLFNVLFGSMSVVGPRPERPELARLYEAAYPNFSLRLKVKAGITGFAQVYGRYSASPEEKLFLDVMYIENFSIWQDLKLMLQTLKILFWTEGAEGVEKERQ